MNESAFPYAYFDKQLNQTRTMYGMSLRDYFAAKAMQAYMANEVWRPEVFKLGAQTSYLLADAMIKARGE